MTQWIIDTVANLGYIGIFLLMLLEGIFPPIPSELIIPMAGYSAAQGDFHIVGVILVATVAAVIGMLPWYLLGRMFGLGRVKWLADRYGRWLTINANEIDRATAWFNRYGPWIVLFGRLIPLVRTLISIPAGLARMRLPVFLAASSIGALAWNCFLAGAGYLLAEHHDRIEAWLDPLVVVVIIGIVVFYIYRLIVWRPSGDRSR